MSDVTHDFYESNRTGKLGEYVVMNYLHSLKKVKDMVDVSDNPNY